jgi:ornithine cyclodeaminase/alanine dehydrogenase-like protein (mu-crystallin family)
MIRNPDIRIIGSELVRELFDMDGAIAAMREAFTAVSSGRAVQPLRSMVTAEGVNGILGLMPGAFAAPEPALGIKVVSIFEGNFSSTLGTHQGAILMFDPSDGRLQAVIDAREVTVIRTAAATAVATDALARPDSRRLTLLGYGEQAASHLDALRRVRPISAVVVWGRSPERAQAFAAEQREKTGLAIQVAACVEAAVAGADIVCTLTAAKDPILRGDWIAPGTHVNAVGSSVPSAAEIDDGLVAKSRVFADYAVSAEALGGELKRAKACGAIGEGHIAGEVGAVLSGAVPGRRSPEEITLFKSLGMAAEDLAAARLILARAAERGAGVVAPF